MSSKLTWVAKPSTDVAKAIQLAEKSSGSILIAKTLGPLSFVLLEEDSYETHKVNLGELHSCECSTFQKTEEPCVHICWLLLRKFKVQPQDEIMYQKGLNENYLRSLFNMERYHELKKAEKAKIREARGRTTIHRRLTRDDECPICFDKFFQSVKGITQCITCKHHVHIQCRNLWKRNGDSENTNRCPYCRGLFGCGSPVPAHCIPWRRTKKTSTLSPTDQNIILVHEPIQPSFNVEFVKGSSLNLLKTQPVQSTETLQEWSIGSSHSYLYIPSSDSHLCYTADRPYDSKEPPVPLHLAVAGRGLPQFNSTQQHTGPSLEDKLEQRQKLRYQIRQVAKPNVLAQAISAIRHRQQMGPKAQASVEGLEKTLSGMDLNKKATSGRQPSKSTSGFSVRRSQLLRSGALPVRSSISEKYFQDIKRVPNF